MSQVCLELELRAFSLYYSQFTEFNSEQIFILRTLSLTFLVSFIVSIVGSKAGHPSWIIFLLLSILTWLSTN